MPASPPCLRQMWTRERWLTVAELCGFAAVASAIALAAYGVAGGIAAAAAGLLAGGIEAIYLANAYALPGEVKAEEKPDAQR